MKTPTISSDNRADGQDQLRQDDMIGPSCPSLGSLRRRRCGRRRLRGLIIVHEVLDRRRRHVEDGRRIEPVENREHDQRSEDRDLARRQVEQALEACLLERAEDDPAVEIERIRCRQDDAGRCEDRDPGVGAERRQQRQEFADEARWSPGRPTLAIVNTMKATAYFGMRSTRPP